jgi:Uma2 family endonuclease
MAGSDPMPPSAHADTRLTYDDLEYFPDDRKRREIIDGELYVTPSPSLRHQVLVGRLYMATASYLAGRPEIGRVFVSPLDVVLSPHDVVEPDLLFVGSDQLEVLTVTNVQGPPALVVEVLSPSTRKTDEQIKRRLFSRVGVREYWLVDPELDLIKVFRRGGDGSFRRVAELTAEDVDSLTSPLLPGFSLPLSDLFAPEL